MVIAIDDYDNKELSGSPQAIANAVAFCGADRILFGTDCKVPGSLDRQKQLLDRDLAIFDEIGLSNEQQQRILAGTADELFPPLD